MPWTYQIASGWLISPVGMKMAQGYSGSVGAVNDPSKVSIPNVGPIPPNLYEMGEPIDSATHGPFAIPLTPIGDGEMYGRSGFMMHGDSIERPGAASEGCIIQPRFARNAAWASPDHQLQVVTGSD